VSILFSWAISKCKITKSAACNKTLSNIQSISLNTIN
jgi:hypothetical protein